MRKYLNSSNVLIKNNQIVQIQNKGQSKISQISSTLKDNYLLYDISNCFLGGQNYGLKLEISKSHVLVVNNHELLVCDDDEIKKTVSSLRIDIVDDSFVEYFGDNIKVQSNYDFLDLTSINLTPMSSLVYLSSIESSIKDIPELLKLQTKIAVGGEIVTNQISSLTENNDFRMLGLFNKFSNYDRLFVIHPLIDEEYVQHANSVIGQIRLQGFYDIHLLNVSGFVLHLLTHDKESSKQVIEKCCNLVRTELLHLDPFSNK